MQQSARPPLASSPICPHPFSSWELLVGHKVTQCLAVLRLANKYHTQYQPVLEWSGTFHIATSLVSASISRIHTITTLVAFIYGGIVCRVVELLDKVCNIDKKD